MEDFNDKHKHEKQELHIVFDNPLKIDSGEIIEAINHWHEAELDAIIKSLRASIKDLKRTPVK